MQEQGLIGIGLAIIVLILAFLYKARTDYTTFRWMFLVGYMGLVGGFMASDLISFWYAFGLFISWFFVAGYFYFQERRGRSNSTH